jgi:hypothetical protein
MKVPLNFFLYWKRFKNRESLENELKQAHVRVFPTEVETLRVRKLVNGVTQQFLLLVFLNFIINNTFLADCRMFRKSIINKF